MPLALPEQFVAGWGELFTTLAQLADGFLRLGEQPGLGGELMLANWVVKELDEKSDEQTDRGG